MEMSINLNSWTENVFCLKDFILYITRPEGLLDPKIRDEMSDFLEIFPTENQI